MKLFIIALLYLITFAIFNVTGYVLLKKASKYPNTDIGYHIKRAMKDKRTWEKTNKIAGICCIVSGICGFAFLPVIVYVISENWKLMLCQYFITALVCILTILLLPSKIIGSKESR